jgi:hypothetical protein
MLRALVSGLQHLRLPSYNDGDGGKGNMRTVIMIMVIMMVMIIIEKVYVKGSSEWIAPPKVTYL